METTLSTTSVDDITSKMYLIDLDTVKKLESLHIKFALLVDNVRRQLNVKCVSVESLQTYLLVHLKLEISPEISTINELLKILYPYFCFIQYYRLEDFISSFLEDSMSLKQNFKEYKKELENFKKLVPIKALCSQILLEMSKGTSKY